MATKNSFILLSIFIASRLDVASSECLLFRNKCVNRCPPRMHPYHTRCDRDTLSQRTCDDPLIYTIGYTCGWSRCDCNGDALLEEATWACVDMMTCIANRKTRKARPPRPGRISKKLRLEEFEDFFEP